VAEATEKVVATPREGKFNKNHARRVRVAGKLPGVVYGAKGPSIAVELDPKQMLKILHSETGHNTIFDLEIAGATPTKAMIVDWQFEPIKDRLIHMDLKRIAFDVRIRVDVPINLVGTPVGVKTEGGILDQVVREVGIESLPADIPGHIDVDVSGLKLGEQVRIADLPKGNYRFLGEDDLVIAHVVAVKEEAATADAIAAAAGQEPEVAKKGKGDASSQADQKK
jgi:large subunit ribosomal protein L25